MLQLIKTYHDHLVTEAQLSGRFRLPTMAIRMLLCQVPVAVTAMLASVLRLDEPARLALALPVGALSIAAVLHLGYVFTEAFQKVAQQ